MISPKCKECEACGWCEYDPLTDTVYPGDDECKLTGGNEHAGK